MMERSDSRVSWILRASMFFSLFGKSLMKDSTFRIRAA